MERKKGSEKQPSMTDYSASASTSYPARHENDDQTTQTRRSIRRSVSESRIVTDDEMREMQTAMQQAAFEPHNPLPMQNQTGEIAWPTYYNYPGYDPQATAEWSAYYQTMLGGTYGMHAAYDPYTAAAATAAYYGATSPEAIAAAQVAQAAAEAAMINATSAPSHSADPTTSATPATSAHPAAHTSTISPEPPQPTVPGTLSPGMATMHSPMGWNTAILERLGMFFSPPEANLNTDPVTANTLPRVGTVQHPSVNSNLSTTRRRAVKHVPLTNGNLVVDCPVPNKLLEQCAIRNRDEVTKLRYTAITCDPDDFSQRNYTLRPAIYKRKTEIFIVVTMYNEDDILFCRTMHGIMRNIQHLCSRSRSSTWGEDGWKKVVVCIVSDGRDHVHPRVLNVLSILGLYQDGIAKNQVNGRDVVAHLFEYTTQLSVTTSMKVHGYEKGIVPCQMMFCLKERNAKKINSHRWFFNAFAPILDPNVCILLDVGTRPGDTSIYHLWKAFDLDPLVGGACGEVGVMKGVGWWHLLNPLVAAQHFEYKMSNILDKPLESTFGYISVLPGAFSAYRYAAIKNDARGRGPLASYFRGEPGYRPPLQPGERASKPQEAGIFEANMYLAEDRILCFEVVAKRHERWLLRYVRSAYGETDVPQSLAEFIAQRRRWLNGSFFAAVYALSRWYRIWQSGHGALRNIGFFFQFLYTLFSVIFSWFGMANFYLAFHFLSRIMAHPNVDPIPNNNGVYITYLLDYIYLILMVAMFVSSLGNRPKGSKLLYMTAMILFALFMAYMIGVAIYLSVRSINRAIAQTQREQKDATATDVIFNNVTVINIIVSVASTYGVYLLSSVLYLQPWHMITSFVQYLLLMPTYVNVLNVYAFCNTHDISWGTKSQTSHKLDLGIAVPMPDKQGPKAVQLVLPSAATDLDAAYTDALTVLKTPVTQEVSKRDAKTRLEDYYRMIRTWLVLFWIMSNAVLALVISSDYINGLLEPSNQDELEDENLAKHMYLTHWYFIAVLWCIAAMALVRFIGSFIYLVQYTFSRGR